MTTSFRIRSSKTSSSLLPASRHEIFRKRAKMQDLLAYDSVLAAPSVETRRWVDRAFDLRGLPRPTPRSRPTCSCFCRRSSCRPVCSASSTYSGTNSPSNIADLTLGSSAAFSSSAASSATNIGRCVHWSKDRLPPSDVIPLQARLFDCRHVGETASVFLDAMCEEPELAASCRAPPDRLTCTYTVSTSRCMAAAQQRYAGKVTQVGNSKGIRLDAAFFKAHPEFGGEVQATVLAEGQVLLSTKAKRRTRAKQAEAPDPVVASFLGFLERQMREHPDAFDRSTPSCSTRSANSLKVSTWSEALQWLAALRVRAIRRALVAQEGGRTPAAEGPRRLPPPPDHGTARLRL